MLGDATTTLTGCSFEFRLILDAVVGGAWLSKGLGMKFFGGEFLGMEFSGGDCRNSGGDTRGFSDECRLTSNTSYCIKTTIIK